MHLNVAASTDLVENIVKFRVSLDQNLIQLTSSWLKARTIPSSFGSLVHPYIYSSYLSLILLIRSIIHLFNLSFIRSCDYYSCFRSYSQITSVVAFQDVIVDYVTLSKTIVLGTSIDTATVDNLDHRVFLLRAWWLQLSTGATKYKLIYIRKQVVHRCVIAIANNNFYYAGA